jgi:hypothetical protein
MAHWYLKASTIYTNKAEAERIAKDLLRRKLWKTAKVKKRLGGYWVEVSK